MKLVFTSLLAALATAAHAQRPAAFPPPGTYNHLTPDPTLSYQTDGRPSAFQDLSGHWHAVQIGEYTAQRAYFNEGGRRYQAYLPREIQAFVRTPGDTLVALTGPANYSREAGGVFGNQLYRGGGLQLVDAKTLNRSVLERLLARPALLLRQGQGPWVRVPKRKAQFQQLFLTLLADDPAVVAELRQGQARPGRDAERLLRQYAENRLTQALRPATGARP